MPMSKYSHKSKMMMRVLASPVLGSILKLIVN